MARRIAIAMLALVGALLVAAVVPLGLLATSREQQAFSADAVLSARTLAAVAEEGLSDHHDHRVLEASINRSRKPDDYVQVYNAAGRLVAASGPAGRQDPAVPRSALDNVLLRGGVTEVSGDDRVWAVASTRTVAGGGGSGGAVVLSRSSGELDERLRILWAWLLAVAAAVLIAGAAATVAFTRWVAKPLSALDVAAARLGSGALSTRASASEGPPEVRRLAGSFNTMAGRLEALVHGHRATMADVSHQLRTPLAALRLRLDLLAQDAGQDAAADLAGAQEEIARLSRLVDGLLAVARAENVVAEPVPVAVDAVARDRVAAWRPGAEERDVRLVTSAAAPTRAAMGEGHLEQVLDNLLANALDAVPPGGHVLVSVSGDGHGAKVTVADDGPGMSAEQQQAAFRRFASSTPGGAGLGLAIVHRLVTANGGSAALSDTPGGGLTVVLELPAPGP
jgi:signal transduction histidine kinase